jgi:hypothetical protein
MIEATSNGNRTREETRGEERKGKERRGEERSTADKQRSV